MNRIATHPGEVLREDFMIPLGLSANALSRALDVPPNRITALTAGERLMRLPPLNLSTVRVTPAEPMRDLKLKDPVRLRISMQGDRPAYRINTGKGFGAWTVVYADTGEKMAPMDAAAAMDWMRCMRYVTLLTCRFSSRAVDCRLPFRPRNVSSVRTRSAPWRWS